MQNNENCLSPDLKNIAKKLSVSPTHLKNIFQFRYAPSVKLAKKIEDAIGIPWDLWFNNQFSTLLPYGRVLSGNFKKALNEIQDVIDCCVTNLPFTSGEITATSARQYAQTLVETGKLIKNPGSIWLSFPEKTDATQKYAESIISTLTKAGWTYLTHAYWVMSKSHMSGHIFVLAKNINTIEIPETFKLHGFIDSEPSMPDELARFCINKGCGFQETIIDPFFSTGLVGKICMEEGRRFIGYEKDVLTSCKACFNLYKIAKELEYQESKIQMFKNSLENRSGKLFFCDAKHLSNDTHLARNA